MRLIYTRARESLQTSCEIPRFKTKLGLETIKTEYKNQKLFLFE